MNPEILQGAKKGAKLIFVGKEHGRHIIAQEEINRIIIDESAKCEIVVRLKGGDPFVFGRGGEEARELRKYGIEFEVVPGVTSAIAVPEAAGIPITDRRVASSFTIITGHRAAHKGRKEVDLSRVESDTIIVLMGLGNLEHITGELMKTRSPTTPVAVIQQGTTKSEKVVTGTLEDIVNKVLEEKIRAPTIIVIGEVVNLRREIAP
ncbi:uroporphyrinogen-III C-methyltransferase [archaeon BMS3Bbin16]|nr:uroporphyrinogen-III C-methyltransferase [archaeon BMS3Bbin16]